MSANHKPTLRTISVLEFVSSGNDEYTLTEISNGLKIPMSTLFPIVHTLREQQYLRYNERSQTYGIGFRMFEIGSRIHSSDIYASIVDVMWTLVDVCNETCHFGILDAGNVLYLAKVDSRQPIRMFSMTGRRLAAYGTGIGKALLKDFTLEELKNLYPDGLKPLTKNTITSYDELFRQLQCIEADTFAYENEESNESIRCIAIPIYRDGKVAAALSVAIPCFRYDEEKKECVETALKDAAKRIEQMVPYLNL